MSILSAPLSNFFCATPCVPMFVSSSSSYSFPCSRFSRNSVGVGLKERARKPRCVCVIYQSKVRATAEVAGAKEASSLVVSSFGEEDKHSRHFLDVRSEEELLFGIWKETEGGGLPPNVAAGMEELYLNYRCAVSRSGDPRADEVVLSNMSVLFDRILLDMEDPFVFSPYHRAKREPFDYYMFGQNYIGPLVDFRNSYVGNIALFYEIEDKLEQGHNIVLISNHQTEADPAIIALLLEKTNRHIAENMTYVAGDRVVTDPLCKPFSMGRNLVCVYSKKHMHDVPELAEMKRRANTRSLKEMDLLLRGGSQIIWIATSGGRDRPDPLSEEWHPWQYILFHTDMRGSGTL